MTTDKSATARLGIGSDIPLASASRLCPEIKTELLDNHSAQRLLQLNRQPMRFYSPAQLIEDARHHGVTTLIAAQ